jgi:type II secretory pathway predicted ATPase ExeA
MERTIIETGASAMLRSVAREVIAGAGLAVLRGPVGIGKTFALDLIEAELTAEGVDVVRVTANPAISGNVHAFMRAILGPNCVETGSTADAADAVWSMLHGYPFRSWGRRVLLIIDEAQELAGRVLETIRGIWDMGDAARLGDDSAPAFGCMLVGNSTFMSKGGAQRVASFRPLLSRLTHDLRLPSPGRVECAALAAVVFPDAPELQAMLAGLGEDRGNLCAMAIAARQAAGGDAVTMVHLRSAIRAMGGK